MSIFDGLFKWPCNPAPEYIYTSTQRLPFREEIKILGMKEGDIVVVKTDKKLSHADYDRIKERLEAAIVRKETKIIILEDMDMEIIRREVIDESI
jgi:hypothetical protein